MMADQRAREDSFRQPVQDLDNKADLAAELAKLLKQNPDLKAQVSENLRHRHLQLVINEAGPPAPPWGSKLQTITSALQAVIRFVFVFLMTALQTFTDVIKMEEEILKELRDKFDGMKRNLEGVEMKLKKVEQVVGNLKETIQRAVEDDYKISNAGNKKLETGFVTTKCDLDSFEDAFTCVREANTRLQESTTSARNLLIVGIVSIMAAVFSAGFWYSWDGDDDLKAKGMKTYIALAGFLVAAGAFLKQKAQSFLNNRKLLTECEEFKHNDLQKAELLAKDIKRDVEVRLPLLKKQLHVLDIDVSRHASFQRPHWE